MKKIHFGLLAYLLLAAPISCLAETVRSGNFELYDKNGKMTAQLTTSGDGTPAFFIYDQLGVTRISIGLYPDGAPGVVLNDNKGLAGAIVRLVDNTGEPVVVLKQNGEDRYVIRKNGPDAGASTEPRYLLLVAIIVSIATSSLVTLLILRFVHTRSPAPVNEV